MTVAAVVSVVEWYYWTHHMAHPLARKGHLWTFLTKTPSRSLCARMRLFRPLRGESHKRESLPKQRRVPHSFCAPLLTSPRSSASTNHEQSARHLRNGAIPIIA